MTNILVRPHYHCGVTAEMLNEKAPYLSGQSQDVHGQGCLEGGYVRLT